MATVRRCVPFSSQQVSPWACNGQAVFCSIDSALSATSHAFNVESFFVALNNSLVISLFPPLRYSLSGGVSVVRCTA